MSTFSGFIAMVDNFYSTFSGTYEFGLHWHASCYIESVRQTGDGQRTL